MYLTLKEGLPTAQGVATMGDFEDKSPRDFIFLNSLHSDAAGFYGPLFSLHSELESLYQCATRLRADLIFL